MDALPVRAEDVNHALLPFGATPRVEAWSTAHCQEWVTLATEGSSRYRQLLPEQRDALLQGLLVRIANGTLPGAEWRASALQRQQGVLLVENGNLDSANRLVNKVHNDLKARIPEAPSLEIKADLLFDLGGAAANVAWLAWQRGEPKATDLYSESLRLFRAASSLCPERWSYLRAARLIKALHDFALITGKPGAGEESITMLDEAIALGAEIGLTAVEVRAEVTTCHSLRAWQLANLGRRDEALAAYDEALAIFETNPPQATERHEQLADLLYNRAFELNAADRCDEAVEDYRRAIALYSKLDQARADVRRLLGDAYGGLGDCEFKLGRIEAALGGYRQAIALLATLEERQEAQIRIGLFQRRLAQGLCDLGRLVEAEEAYAEAIRVLEALSPGFPSSFAELRKSYQDRASVLRLLGRGDEALIARRKVPEVVLLSENEFGMLFDSTTQVSPDSSGGRISDLATFLTYRRLPDEHLAWAYQRLGMGSDEFAELRTRLEFRIAPLSFYPNSDLLVVEDKSRRGRAELFALCRLGDEVCAIDWTNRPIYEANSRWGIDLATEKQIIEYCRFFFHFVYGRFGPFQIFDDVGELPWKEVATEADFAKVREIASPLRLVPSTGPNEHRLESRMLFRDAVFSSIISVQTGAEDPERRGLISLSNEELLEDGLPVYESPSPYLRDRPNVDHSPEFITT